MLRGIMISEDDSNIDFSSIQDNNIKFIIIRAGYTSYGKNKMKYKDSKFEEYYNRVLGENYEVFVYYESCATSIKEAREEADYFLSIIEDKEILHPLFVFINDDHNTVIYSGVSQKELSKHELTSVVNEFCKTINEGDYDIFILSDETWIKEAINVSEVCGICLNTQIDDSKRYRYINISEKTDDKDKIEIVLNKSCMIDKIGKMMKFLKNKIGKIFK